MILPSPLKDMTPGEMSVVLPVMVEPEVTVTPFFAYKVNMLPAGMFILPGSSVIVPFAIIARFPAALIVQLLLIAKFPFT